MVMSRTLLLIDIIIVYSYSTGVLIASRDRILYIPQLIPRLFRLIFVLLTMCIEYGSMASRITSAPLRHEY